MALGGVPTGSAKSAEAAMATGTHSSKAGILGRIAAWMAGTPVIVHTMHGLPFNPAQSKPAFWATDHDAEKFSWIDANDAGNNVFSFVRYGPDDSGGRSAVACIANFSAIPHHGYRLGLPYAGRWEEVVNTDATSYGGSGVGNFGAVEANGTPWHGLESSAELSVPPLATVYLRFTG